MVNLLEYTQPEIELKYSDCVSMIKHAAEVTEAEMWVKIWIVKNMRNKPMKPLDSLRAILDEDNKSRWTIIAIEPKLDIATHIITPEGEFSKYSLKVIEKVWDNLSGSYKLSFRNINNSFMPASFESNIERFQWQDGVGFVFGIDLPPCKLCGRCRCMDEACINDNKRKKKAITFDEMFEPKMTCAGCGKPGHDVDACEDPRAKILLSFACGAFGTMWCVTATRNQPSNVILATKKVTRKRIVQTADDVASQSLATKRLALMLFSRAHATSAEEITTHDVAQSPNQHGLAIPAVVPTMSLLIAPTKEESNASTVAKKVTLGMSVQHPQANTATSITPILMAGVLVRIVQKRNAGSVVMQTTTRDNARYAQTAKTNFNTTLVNVP
ncbi:hypothetical protein LTS08_006285 [Lithohypha guttulata]|nr:hypothetical protein LTS08_006285 [Lithohypha guttulata]